MNMAQIVALQLQPWLLFLAVVLAAIMAMLWMWRAIQPTPSAEDLTALPGERRLVFGPLTEPLAQMLPDLFARQVDRDLARGGYNHPAAKSDYLALRNMLFCGSLLASGVWLVALADEEPAWRATVIVVGVVSAVLCYSLPRLYLSWYGDRRAARIVAGFPDALDTIVMALAGGLPLQSALDRASGQLNFVHPDLAWELEVVRRQSYASSLPEALRRLAARLDEDDISHLTTLVTHAEQLGTNVAGVLREYADNLRNNALQRATERGNRLSLQMLFPILFCLAPATFLILMAPGIMRLQEFRDEARAEGGVLSQRKVLANSASPGAPRAPRPPRSAGS